MNEPKVVVLNPKEDCLCWMVVDSGGLGKVPIKELFKGITGDSFQYLVAKSFKVPGGSDSSKGKFFSEFFKDERGSLQQLTNLSLLASERDSSG